MKTIRILSLLGSLLTVSAVLNYYPIQLFAFAVVGASAFSIITLWRPQVSLFLLFAITPFFGNHPGGRFMELFPLLCLLWLTISETRHPHKIGTRFLYGYSIFLLILFLPLIFQRDLLVDTLFRKNGLFYILYANEHDPLYSLQQILWLALIPLFAVSALKYRRSIVQGLTVAFILTVTVGIIESLSTSAAVVFNQMHRFIDGYVHVTEPHGPMKSAFRSGWITQSPNSLFWNRSWHAVYLIACLPFVASSLYESIQKRRNMIRLIAIGISVIAMSLYFLVIGARGALAAWLVFLVVITGSVLLLRVKRLKRFVPVLLPVGVIAALVLQILVPLLIAFLDIGRTEERYSQFVAAVRIWLNFPIFGGGTESYGYYNNIWLRSASEAAEHGSSHNQFLQVLVGNGITGAFFYCALLTGFALRMRDDFRKATTHGEQIRLILLTAGMVAALTYGIVQEWNYIRPVILLWVILLLFTGAETPASAAKANSGLGWAVVSLLLMGLAFSYRADFHNESDLPHTALEIPAATRPPFNALPIGEVPVIAATERWPDAPWMGVELVTSDHFAILQGKPHILLPSDMKPDSFTALRSGAHLQLGWVINPQHPEHRLLVIRCTADPGVPGDIDARRLCVLLHIPGASTRFASFIDPARYPGLKGRPE